MAWGCRYYADDAAGYEDYYGEEYDFYEECFFDSQGKPVLVNGTATCGMKVRLSMQSQASAAHRTLCLPIQNACLLLPPGERRRQAGRQADWWCGWRLQPSVLLQWQAPVPPSEEPSWRGSRPVVGARHQLRGEPFASQQCAADRLVGKCKYNNSMALLVFPGTRAPSVTGMCLAAPSPTRPRF